MAVLRAKTSFSVGNPDRTKHFVGEGTLVDSRDPIVKGREELFEPVEASVRSFIEQATANPGEARSVTRVAKKP